jgi:hypothetical protein
MALWDITQVTSEALASTNLLHAGLINLDGEHFVVFYRGVDNDGFARIAVVDSSYAITYGTALEFLTADVEYLSGIKVDNTHFMIAYTDVTSNDGFIKCFEMASDHTISNVSTLEFDTADGEYSSLCKLSDTLYAVAYSGTSIDGFVKTISLNTSTYAMAAVGSLEYNTTNSIQNNIITLDSTHFAIAYRGPAEDAFLDTFVVSGSTITKIDTLNHDTGYGSRPALYKLDDTHLLLAYAGTGDRHGIVKTFSFDSNFDNLTQIDSLQHITVPASSSVGEHAWVKLSSTHFALACRDNTNKYMLKIFSIDSNFDNITAVNSVDVVNSVTALELDTSYMVQINANHVLYLALASLTSSTLRVYNIQTSLASTGSFFPFFI